MLVNGSVYYLVKVITVEMLFNVHHRYVYKFPFYHLSIKENTKKKKKFFMYPFMLLPWTVECKPEVEFFILSQLLLIFKFNFCCICIFHASFFVLASCTGLSKSKRKQSVKRQKIFIYGIYNMHIT